jgi:beta-lactamase regulating signal transducer with metallopeptidase domain
MPWTESVYSWLVHSALVSLAVLLIGSGAVLLCRQPTRRLRIIALTLAGCLGAPCLGLIPGYPHLAVGWRPAATTGGDKVPMPSAGEIVAPAVLPDVVLPADVRPPLRSVPPPERVPDTAPSQAHSFPIASLIVAVYLSGVALGLAWWLAGMAGLARTVWTARPGPPRCRQMLAEIAGRRAGRVRLLSSERVRQPFASVWGRPLIVLPEDVCGDEQSLRWALAHEWAHIERRHFLVWLLAGLARVVFFYQPLVWWLRRQLRLCQDFVADAQAARQSPQPEDYAELLTGRAKAGSLRPAMAGLGMGFYRSDLYRRVVMVVRSESVENRAPRPWSAAVTIAALALAGAASAITLGGRAVAQQEPAAAGPAAPANGDAKGQQNEQGVGKKSAPTKTIVGVVVDEAGKPVPDAQVWMRTNAGFDDRTATAHGRTDGRGRFTLEIPVREPLFPGERRSATVWALAPGHGLSTGIARDALSAEEGGPEVKIMLRPAARTEFLILTPEGKRLAGAVVRPRQFLGASGPASETRSFEAVPNEVCQAVQGTTGADGRVSVPGLPHDVRSVRVISEPYGTWVQAFSMTEPIPAETTIRLPPAGRVEGHLIADDPKVVRAVGILLETRGSSYEDTTLPGVPRSDPADPQRGRRFPSFGQAQVVSDNEGRFVVPAIAEGKLYVSVQIDKDLPYRAEVPQSLSVTNPDPTRVEIRILPAVRVEGVVRTEGTGQPIAKSWVFVQGVPRPAGDRPAARDITEFVATDEQGKYAAYVLPGDLQVQLFSVPDRPRLPARDYDKRYSVPAGVDHFDIPPLEVSQSPAGKEAASPVPDAPAAAPPGDAPAAATRQLPATKQREEKTTGLTLGVLFMIMGSVEGQKDLNLTEDQKLKARYADLSTILPREADPREYQTEAYQKKEDEAAKAMIDMLTPAQFARLRQIAVQWRGVSALTRPAVVSALGITDDQKTKLQDLESKFLEQKAKAAEQSRTISADRNLSQEERQAKLTALQNEFRQVRERWNEAAIAILTPQQREKFEGMKGAKFGTRFHLVPKMIDDSWMTVLRMPAVQDDLKLANAQNEKLSEVWKSTQLPERITVLEREKTLDEAAKAVDGILSPEQAARLKQLNLQWLLLMRKPGFVLSAPDVASALGITEDQQQRLVQLSTKPNEKLAALNTERITPEERARRLKQLRKEEAEQAMPILTPQQREKLEAMKGAEFDWSSGF